MKNVGRKIEVKKGGDIQRVKGEGYKDKRHTVKDSEEFTELNKW